MERLLAAGGDFTSRDVAELTGLPRRTVSRRLATLVSSGELTAIGENRHRRYAR